MIHLIDYTSTHTHCTMKFADTHQIVTLEFGPEHSQEFWRFLNQLSDWVGFTDPRRDYMTTPDVLNIIASRSIEEVTMSELIEVSAVEATYEKA